MSSTLRIIYKPEGASRKSWDVDLENPAWDLHKAAPKAAGFRGWVPFAQALEDFDADAWQAMIWALRRREQRGLTFEAVDFPTGLANELDFVAQCPKCSEWVGEDADDLAHECPAEDDPEDADPQP